MYKVFFSRIGVHFFSINEKLTLSIFFYFLSDFSIKAAEIGNDALSGKDGPAKDTLIYTGALTLSIIKNIDFNDAAEQIKKVINSGKAKEFFYNAK